MFGIRCPSLSGSEVDPAPTALPARSNGCGGAENEKAPAYAEADDEEWLVKR